MDKYAIYRLRFEQNRTYYELTDNNDFERYIREVISKGYHDNSNVNACYAAEGFVNVECVADNVEAELARPIFNTIVTIANETETILNRDDELADCMQHCKLSSISKAKSAKQSAFACGFNAKEHTVAKELAKYAIDDMYFESATAAAKAVGLPMHIVRQRFKSDAWPTWQCLEYDKEEMKMLKRQRRATKYNSIARADRAKAKQERLKGEHAKAKIVKASSAECTAPAKGRKPGKGKWKINGQEYTAFKDILADYDIAATTAYHRLKSPHFPTWQCVTDD